MEFECSHKFLLKVSYRAGSVRVSSLNFVRDDAIYWLSLTAKVEINKISNCSFYREKHTVLGLKLG